MATILKELESKLPAHADISEVKFEASEIVLYTKNKEFFQNGEDTIKAIVREIKKRVELRPDLSITQDPETAKDYIQKTIPAEAGIQEIYFEPELGKVIIECAKPGLVIGKGGETFRDIRNKTCWLPKIERAPAMKSSVVRAVRNLLHTEIDYRKKFLNKIGQRINTELDKGENWVRVSCLGAARQVGRSSFLVQTRYSNVLLDCGITPGNGEFPLFNAPEYNIDNLDAVILSHSHIDHGALIPFLYEQGFTGPLYCTAPTRDTIVMLCLDYIDICQKNGINPPYPKKAVEKMVKHSVALNYGEVSDITPDIRLTLQPAGHLLGSSLVHLHIGDGLHNILYSLDGSTPVTVLDAEDSVHFQPIGKIIDRAFSAHPALVERRGPVEDMPNVDGLKTIAFNPRTFRTEVKDITRFVRHPITEELYEICTESGKKAMVTRSHSVFTAQGGRVQAVKVGELGRGDYILGPRQLPESPGKRVLDLFAYKDKVRIHVNDHQLLDRLLLSYEKKLAKLRLSSSKREVMSWLRDFFEGGMYKTGIAKKYGHRVATVSKVFSALGVHDHPRVGHSLPSHFHLTKEFARFLGYFVAEGSVRVKQNTIQITNTNLSILEDAQKIIRDLFGIEGDLRKKDDVVLFYSKPLRILLEDVLQCGRKARQKRVPPQLLFAGKDVAAQFLKGYFSGDGTIRVRSKGNEISATSKSPHLMQDIGFLLLHFGIVPRYLYNKVSDMHTVAFYGYDHIKAFHGQVGMMNKSASALDAYLASHQRTGRKQSFDRRIPLRALSVSGQDIISRTPWNTSLTCGIPQLEEMDVPDTLLLESDFVFDRVKEIRKVKPTGKYVYDFSVEGYENFTGGSGFLFLHNTGDLKYGPTRLFDPAWTDFQRVETLIMESTYGASNDVLPPRQDVEKSLMDMVNRTVERGGKALIPSFAVGRGQEVMAILEANNFQHPVWMEGMIWDATAIHTAYPEFLSQAMQRNIFRYGKNPFTNEIFRNVAPKERDAVIDSAEPGVVVATSGMLIGGPAIEYLKGLAPNPKNSLVFVGWQHPATLGSRIQKGWREIPMTGPDGKTKGLKIDLEVDTVHGMTGHCGRNELMNFVRHLSSRPERIVTVHGEARKCQELARDLHHVFNIETLAPRPMEAIRLK
ncbi:MAG: MBL fold metallo-hydrolase [Candidatus Aenigmarchaeota archaeon]|nr:MBL fold metallo-hydrolase [Candidatus Aenigmarchaeota archaeon]